MASHYDAQRVRQGLVHFLVGKGFTAISTVSVLVLLARALPKEDFAALIVFESLLAITGLATSFGVNQTLLRYLPELRTQGNGLALYHLIKKGMLSRGWIVGLALAALALLAPMLSEWLGFQRHADAFRWFLVSGWASLMWFLLGQVMESLMWQKTSQYAIAVTAALRLILLAICYAIGTATLMQVVLIEIFCHWLTLGLLVVGVRRNWRNDPHRADGSLDWFDDNKARIKRYAIGGYGFTLSTLLYGSQPNRAIAARFLPPAVMGEYGFADSLTALFRRFLPSALLIGFIRPLYFARYTESGQLHYLERMANLIFRVNLIFLGSVALALLFLGEPFLNWLTGGKYGGTAYISAAMVGVLAIESLQLQHALMCQTLERNGLLIVSNLILSISLLISVPLISSIGGWAIVVANFVGNVLATVFIRVGLASRGQVMALDTSLILKVVVSGGLAGAIGGLAMLVDKAMIGGTLAIVAWFAMNLYLRPFSSTELQQFAGFLGRRSPRSC